MVVSSELSSIEIKDMLKYAYGLLGEASTYRGLVTFLAGLGIAVAPEYVSYLSAAGLLLHGLIGICFKDQLN